MTYPRLIEAMHCRYKAGDKPTYTLNGPERVHVRLRKDKDGGFTTMSMAGDEPFSPVSVYEQNGIYWLCLTPLSVNLIGTVSQIKVRFDQASQKLNGFAKHLEEVGEAIQDETMAEIRAERQREEARLLAEEKERIRIMSQPGWGDF